MPPTPVSVRWELATDASMRRIVTSGIATATPEPGHSVHVEVAGLAPQREYFPAAFLPRRAAAFQPFDENMPLRHTSVLTRPDMQSFRTVAYGQRAHDVDCAMEHRGQIFRTD
jgi:phosphodiesterase/alkaline phosphatase D-like protein